MADRGILVAAGIEFDRRSQYLSAGLHYNEFHQNVRKWCLFWDRILVLKGYGHQVRSDTFDYLEKEGLLQVLPVRTLGGLVVDTLHEAHLAAMSALEESEPGVWAVDLSAGSLYCPHHPFFTEIDPQRRGLIVTLQNVIPIPHVDVPIAEILEFKERRRPELERLRHHIEDLYQRIANASDPALGLNTALESIQTAGNDAIRLAREHRLPFVMSTDMVTINAVAAVAAALPGILAQASLTTILSNVAPAAIAVNLGLGWGRRKSLGTPFQYVTQYHAEVFPPE